MIGALHVATAVRPRADGSVMLAAVLRWNGTGASRVVVRRQRETDMTVAAYRALLLGLGEARRAGARELVLYAGDVSVAAQLKGVEPAPAGALGPYLQVRALLNAFRFATVRHVETVAGQEAVFAAAAAVHSRRPAYSDLPLWAAAS